MPQHFEPEIVDFSRRCAMWPVERGRSAQRFETTTVKNLQSGRVLDSRWNGVGQLTAMATCPKCMGALTGNHRCRQGVFRRASQALSTAAVGSGLGMAACFVIEQRPTGALLVAAAALGAVVAVAVRQAAGNRP